MAYKQKPKSPLMKRLTAKQEANLPPALKQAIKASPAKKFQMGCPLCMGGKKKCHCNRTSPMKAHCFKK